MDHTAPFDTYTFVIVGAGSAGCVLANRLSADPRNRVLLVESGPPDTSWLLRMPRGMGKLLQPGNSHVYAYQVIPGGNHQPETWLKGRALGGSSSLNGMVYMRGAPADYDGWEADDCEGWGWSAMGRRFVELEDHQLGADDTACRGAGGPLHVTVHPAGDPLCEAVMSAADRLGTPRVADVNAPAAVRNGGIGYQPRNTWKNQRFSASTAFLEPALVRANLDVMTTTQVLRIEIEAGRATGVTIRNATGTHFIAAEEVILSAGAIESPRLLQLSGIGPAATLRSAGVEVHADVPGVGQNLREHRYVQCVWEVTGNSTNRYFSGLGLLQSLAQYALARRGAMTHAAHEVGGFIKTTPDLPACDAQIGISLHSMKATERGVTLDSTPGLTALGYFGRPSSKGEVRILSPDGSVAPYINSNHFATEEDRTRALALLRWLRRLGDQPSLSPWLLAERGPGARLQSDEDVLQNLLSLGGTSFHIAGTCRMGADNGSVVDPQLRVRGIRGLRVCDTSIMPTLVLGNTNAPAMAMALNAADMILNTHKASG